MKKSVDLLKGKYNKIEQSPRLCTNSEINDNDFNIINRDLYTSKINTENTQNDNSIKKEPPAHIKLKKKIIVKNNEKISDQKINGLKKRKK